MSLCSLMPVCVFLSVVAVLYSKHSLWVSHCASWWTMFETEERKFDLRVNVSSCCCSLSFLSSEPAFTDGRVRSKKKWIPNINWESHTMAHREKKAVLKLLSIVGRSIINQPSLPSTVMSFWCRFWRVLWYTGLLVISDPDKEFISACLLEAF